MRHYTFYLLPLIIFCAVFTFITPASALSIGASPSAIIAEMVQNETGTHRVHVSRSRATGEDSFDIEVSDSLLDIVSVSETSFSFQEGEQSRFIPIVLDTKNAEIGEIEGEISVYYRNTQNRSGVSVRYGVSVVVKISVVEELDDLEIINAIYNNSVGEQVYIKELSASVEKYGDEHAILLAGELVNGSTYRANALPYTISFYRQGKDGEDLVKIQEEAYYNTLASGESAEIDKYFFVPEEIDFGTYRVVVEGPGGGEEIEIKLINPIVFVGLGILIFSCLIICIGGVYLISHSRKKKKRKRKKNKSKKGKK